MSAGSHMLEVLLLSMLAAQNYGSTVRPWFAAVRFSHCIVRTIEILRMDCLGKEFNLEIVLFDSKWSSLHKCSSPYILDHLISKCLRVAETECGLIRAPIMMDQ